MKDDKKKLVVIGALAVVLVGIGAFSFLGGDPAPPAPAAEEKKEGTATDPTVAKVDENGNVVGAPVQNAPKNPLYAMELPQRDPFQGNTFGGQPPISAPTLPPATKQPPRKTGTRRSGGSEIGIPPYRPLEGSLPMAGTANVTPTGPDPSEFGYTVSGTMTGGKKPVAVFTDSNGNQRMVPVGGSLDGDSKVVAVEKGSVTIEHRGKKQRLSLGGNPK